MALLHHQQHLGDPVGTTQASTRGWVEISFGIPSQPSLAGQPLLTQFIFLQPGANALGAFTSNGRRSTIGILNEATRIYNNGSVTATTGNAELHYGLTIGLN